MTAETTVPSADAIDAALAAAAGSPGADEQRLAVAVLRLLAAGKPVSIPAAAAAAGLPGARAGQVLRSWPAVFWDDHDQVTGFRGLALTPMPHRIRRAGTGLYAWCAWDPLFLARVIGDLEIATADPVTGEAITYRISGDGTITGTSHPAAVLGPAHLTLWLSDTVSSSTAPYGGTTRPFSDRQPTDRPSWMAVT